MDISSAAYYVTVIPALAVWFAATALHFLLSARAVARFGAADASLDTRVFDAVLVGVGSLSLVLHVVSMTVGLGLVSGLTGLAMWHAGLFLAAQRVAPHASRRIAVTAIEMIALAVMAGVLLTWIGLAARSADIHGPDAAHYHVPYAVNLAMSASPFDLPATPHLYPMAASMVGAWFIVPTGDPLIVDLAMALPFLLLVASLNQLFRSVTALSGTTWATWLGLALFTTPMFRGSSEGSADLWFAASFVAVVALIVRALADRRVQFHDVVLLGFATGLLVGSKTTGAPAAVLIAAVSVLVFAIRRVSRTPPLSWPPFVIAALATGLIACLGAGGIWLVRNWWQFGSPIAPSGLTILGHTIFAGEAFQQTTYLSVLGEIETQSFHLLPKTQAWVGTWFGQWFLTLLWPIALLAIDLLVRVRQRNSDARWWPRVGLFGLTVVTGAALIWLLIGAPWTALDRSRGLTLRYILPVPALLALLAYAGCFPMSFGWARRAGARAAALAVVIVGTAWMMSNGFAPAPDAPSTSLVPGLTWPWVVAGFVLVGLSRWTSQRRWLTRAIGLVALIAAACWWAPVISRADAAARVIAAERLTAADDAFGAGVVNPDIWRDVLPAIRASERREGSACASSRFFSLTRFDEPLALQPPAFGNQVFYAARDVDAARRAGPLHRCDYIISTPAMDDTDKGKALAAALAGSKGLRLFASTRDLVVWTLAN